MKPRKVFTVKGSEDGNLGVYSNVKLAYERAMQYLNQNGVNQCTVAFLTADGRSIVEREATLANVRKKLVSPGAVDIEGTLDSATVTIERFYLNH